MAETGMQSAAMERARFANARDVQLVIPRLKLLRGEVNAQVRDIARRDASITLIDVNIYLASVETQLGEVIDAWEARRRELEFANIVNVEVVTGKEQP
jgi:hypothetical protein